jgi:purine-cytosine permease-like protein
MAQESSHRIEAHAADYVPESERHGKVWHQGPFWFMTNATFATALTGVVGAQLGLSLPWSVVAILAGSLLGTFFSACHAVQGPRLGLPQLIQSRVQFGSRGAVVPKVLVTLVQGGFGVFYLFLAADALGQITVSHTKLYAVIFTFIAIVVVVVGHDLLHSLLRLLAVLAVADFVILTIAVIHGTGGLHAAQGGSFSGKAFLAQFGAAAGYQLAIAPIVSDYTRYLPRQTRSLSIISMVGLGSMISAVWLEILGAIVMRALPNTDTVGALDQYGNDLIRGFGTVSLALSVPVQIFIAGVSIYSGFLSGVSAVDSFFPVRSSARMRVISLSGVGVVIALVLLVLPTHYLNSFINFLTLLFYFFIPWTAVNLMDFYVVRRGKYAIAEILAADGGVYGRWGWRGLTAYTVGLLAMVPFFSTTVYTGPLAARLGADISALVGLPVSCACYLLLMRGFTMSRELQLSKLDAARLAGATAAEPPSEPDILPVR